MSKSAAKAFGRGFSYHAGAGLGEAVRSVTTLGASAAVLIGIQYATQHFQHTKLQNDLNKLLKDRK